MSANPMQKKARNSFILGVIITLIVCLLIGALLYVLVVKPFKAKEEEEGKIEVIAYTLSQNVKSGQVITSNLLQPITVYQNMIPSNYVDASLLSTMELQDKNGNVLYTNSKGELYLVSDNSSGYKTIANSEKQILVNQDENGYYKTKTSGEKEYIELLSVPVIAKINMNQNTIVTIDAITKSDEVITNDVRYAEYNMISLPTTVLEGDFIDIRLQLPNGQDLIVISKKEIKSLLGNTIGLQLTEGEMLMMNSAIVESYVMTASKLYAIQYVDSGIQSAAVKTYTPTEAVQGLIERDENIVNTAKQALLNRFNGDIRTWTNNERGAYVTEEQSNIEEGIKKEIENARAAREAYLSGLTSY